MQKEDTELLAHLITGMKDAVDRMEKAIRDNDMEGLTNTKKEVLRIQSEIDKIL